MTNVSKRLSRTLLGVAVIMFILVASVAKASDDSVESILKQGNKEGDRAIVSVDGVEYAFRWAPAGSFVMGSSKDGSGEVDFGLNLRSFTQSRDSGG